MTGLLSLWQVWPTLGDRTWYLAAFCLKMLGALGLLLITAQLALPVPVFQGMRTRRGLWSAINIGCAAVILIGAALMRAARLGQSG
jgi:hypothetical protein